MSASDPSVSSSFGSECPIQHRSRLREKLGIKNYLSQREVFNLGSCPVHCELYEAADIQSPLVIFLPGIGTYVELYAELLAKLASQGIHAIGLDYPGHGYSGGSRGRYSVNDVKESVSLLIDYLKERFTGDIFIYGYSIGSLLSVACAESDERIEGVVCGTLLVPEIAPDFVHMLGWQWTWGIAQLVPGLKLPLKSLIDYEQLLAGHPAAKEINHDPLIVFDYPLATLSSLFSCRLGISQRCYPFSLTVLHGDRDEVLSYVYSERLVKSLEHPLRLVRLPGGHMLPWDNPDSVVKEIVNVALPSKAY